MAKSVGNQMSRRARDRATRILTKSLPGRSRLDRTGSNEPASVKRRAVHSRPGTGFRASRTKAESSIASGSVGDLTLSNAA